MPGRAVIWAGVWMGGTILVEEHVATALPLLHSGKPWLIAAAIAALVVLLYALRRRAHAAPETKLTQGVGRNVVGGIGDGGRCKV